MAGAALQRCVYGGLSTLFSPEIELPGTSWLSRVARVHDFIVDEHLHLVIVCLSTYSCLGGNARRRNGLLTFL